MSLCDIVTEIWKTSTRGSSDVLVRGTSLGEAFGSTISPVHTRLNDRETYLYKSENVLSV